MQLLHFLWVGHMLLDDQYTFQFFRAEISRRCIAKSASNEHFVLWVSCDFLTFHELPSYWMGIFSLLVFL
jgi:hypothetical protein